MKPLKLINTPALFCLVWLAFIGVIFTVCVGDDFPLLKKAYEEEVWPEDRLRVPPPPRWLTRDDKTSLEPTVSELLPGDARSERYERAELDGMIPSHEERLDGSPGRPPGPEAPGVLAVADVIRTTGAFSLKLDLGQAPPEIAVSFQHDPSAWLVDIPGAWTRKGKALYEVSGSIVRRFRVLVHENRVRLVIYYTDRAAASTARPHVSAFGNTLTVTVKKP